MACLHIQHLTNDINLYINSVGDDLPSMQTKSGQKTCQKWPEKWPEKWAVNVGKIIEAINTNNKVTIAELEIMLGVGHTTVKKLLHEMQKEHFIRRIGPDKGGHWEVV